MYCICCKRDKVIPSSNEFDESESEEDLLWKNEEIKIVDWSGDERKSRKTINNLMVDGGIIHIIDAGYGSTQDGDRIILAICDDCIKENLEDGTLLYFGNYMFSDKEFIKESVDKSKKIYRRRKNLDSI